MWEDYLSEDELEEVYPETVSAWKQIVKVRLQKDLEVLAGNDEDTIGALIYRLQRDELQAVIDSL